MRFGRKPVLLVCAITEGHDGRAATATPSLNNLPFDYDQVGTVLSRFYHNFRHADNITSLPNVVTLTSRPVLGL